MKKGSEKSKKPTKMITEDYQMSWKDDDNDEPKRLEKWHIGRRNFP